MCECGQAWVSPPLKSPEGVVCFGCSPAETRKGPRKLPAVKKAQSLDRQVSRKDSEFLNSRCPSGPSCRRTASDGARGSGSPPLFAEAQGTAAAAHPPGEGNKLLHSDQGSPEDIKKERPPRQAQQSWVRTFLNLLLMRMEEPKEKTSRKSKGKAERSVELRESAQEPAPRRKSQEKRTGLKKHSHRKRAAEEPPGPQNSGAEGQEDVPPSLAASHTKEADLGLLCRGEQMRVTPLSCPKNQVTLNAFAMCPQLRLDMDSGGFSVRLTSSTQQRCHHFLHTVWPRAGDLTRVHA